MHKDSKKTPAKYTSEQVYRILEACHIPVADWRVARNGDEAVNGATEIGFPVVVKADSRSVVHKNQAGGVKLNLKDKEAVAAAVDEIRQHIPAEDLKFLVQKHMPDGKELIAGAKAEGDLGHLIMFGMGGIHVDVVKDVAFKLAPVTNLEAGDMFSSLKGARLLEGASADSGVDKKGIIETIQGLSQLVTDMPTIKEMDLNPIIAYPDGVSIVDARISL
jgi:acetyltransferase